MNGLLSSLLNLFGVGVDGSQPIIVVEGIHAPYNEWVYFLTNKGGITGPSRPLLGREDPFCIGK